MALEYTITVFGMRRGKRNLAEDKDMTGVRILNFLTQKQFSGPDKGATADEIGQAIGIDPFDLEVNHLDRLEQAQMVSPVSQIEFREPLLPIGSETVEDPTGRDYMKKVHEKKLPSRPFQLHTPKYGGIKRTLKTLM